MAYKLVQYPSRDVEAITNAEQKQRTMLKLKENEFWDKLSTKSKR